MTKPTGRPRGRPLGARNKAQKGIRGTTEFREKLLGSLTEKQIKALPPELKARLASTLVPKDRVQAEEPVLVSFRISGLPSNCPHCGGVIESEPTGVTGAPRGGSNSPAALASEDSSDPNLFRPEQCPGMQEKSPAEVERELLEEAKERAEQAEIDAINRDLAREDAELREANIERTKQGLPPLNSVESIFDGFGIKDS